jgi:hypothetical protein
LFRTEEEAYQYVSDRFSRNLFESEAKQAKWKLKKQEKEQAAN